MKMCPHRNSFTPQTLLFETGFNIKCVSDTVSIQIGDNAYVPMKEFHSMLTESLEKVSLMSYNIDSEDVSDEKLFFIISCKQTLYFIFHNFFMACFYV